MAKKKTERPYPFTVEVSVPPEENPEVQAIMREAEKELEKDKLKKKSR